MKFYETNPYFDNKAFAEICNARGIKAEAKENGVMLDVEKYMSIPLWNMPQWLIQNRKFIASL